MPNSINGRKSTKNKFKVKFTMSGGCNSNCRTKYPIGFLKPVRSFRKSDNLNGEALNEVKCTLSGLTPFLSRFPIHRYL